MPHCLSFLSLHAYSWVCHICALCDEMAMGRLCSAVACSFIALAAWVRQLPFSLLNSCVVTECLQTGHLKMLKPFIILMV
jgi:hypothetical protein